MDNTKQLNSLPPPPKDQTGVSINTFKNLPSPPAGQGGMTIDQVMAQQKPKNDLLNNPVTRGIQSIFPGKQTGEAIGTLGGLAKEKINGVLGGKDNSQYYDTSAPNPLQVAGDVAQGALTIAAPNIGRGSTALGRIGANAALGAGIAGTGQVAQGNTGIEAAKQTALGGIVGGGVSALGETGKYLTENMPKWFTKLALPKLGSQLKGTPQETIDYAINNSKGVTLKGMYNNSNNAVKSFEKQVGAVLDHPQYVNESGNIANGIKSIKESFPNAQLSDAKVGNIIKQVAPQNSSIVDKIIDGTANLKDQNSLRKELDQATKAAYGDKPNLTFAKQIGKSMADFLRKNVQSTAKETEPIFSEYSKEHTLNKALGSALSKKRVAGPLVAGGAGFAHGGVKGALEGIAIEEGLRSPTAKLLAAKGIKAVGSKALPIGKALLQGSKASLIKHVSNQSNS